MLLPASAGSSVIARAWSLLTALSCSSLLSSTAAAPVSGENETLSKSHLPFTQFEILQPLNVQVNFFDKQTLEKPHLGLPAGVPAIFEVEVLTHGRHFLIYLTHDRSVFADGFKALSVGQNATLQKSISLGQDSFFVGHLAGEQSSSVSMLMNGMAIIRAKITTASGPVYHIESASLYRLEYGEGALVAYQSHNIVPSADWEPSAGKRCWRRNVGRQESQRTSHAANSKSRRSVPLNNTSQFVERPPRTVQGQRYAPARNTCGLLLIADYWFYKNVSGGDETIATNIMINSVMNVDKIYRNTVWPNGMMDMGFSIKKVLVHIEPYNESGHYNSLDLLSSNEILDSLGDPDSTNEDLSDYCLVHLFTARHLDGDLGLAETASPNPNQEGGICSGYGNRSWSWFSNIALTNFMRRGGQIMSLTEAEAVLAHELGHNWGSSHDPLTAQCSPYLSNSKNNETFIMERYWAPHLRGREMVFSPCSMKAIGAVLDAKSSHCFEVKRDTLRGNYRIDAGEECDAGIFGDECCDSNFRLIHGPESCSEANHICCKNCSTATAQGKTCRSKSDFSCQAEAVCNGHDNSCPMAYSPLGSKCFANDIGRCQQTADDMNQIRCVLLCEVIGMQSCLCKEAPDACHLCCQNNASDTCNVFQFGNYSSYAQPCGDNSSQHCSNQGFRFEPFEWTNKVQFQENTPCLIGYCNANGVCVKQSMDRISSFLKFFSDITVNAIIQFVKDNIVGTIILSSLLLWIPPVLCICRADSKRQRQLAECSRTSSDTERIIDLLMDAEMDDADSVFLAATDGIHGKNDRNHNEAAGCNGGHAMLHRLYRPNWASHDGPPNEQNHLEGDSVAATTADLSAECLLQSNDSTVCLLSPTDDDI